MFYSHEVLTSRKYGVATVWLVATLGQKSNARKVSRKQILDVNVPKACETIITPEAPMALRLQSNLLYGVSRVYDQQCGYVLADAQAAQNMMRALLKVVRAANLNSTPGKTRPDTLLLDDDPAFLPDAALMPLLEDILRLGVPPTFDDSQLTASLSFGGTPVPPSNLISLSSQSASVGDFALPDSDSISGGPLLSTLLAREEEPALNLDWDLGLSFDADGNLQERPSAGAISQQTPARPFMPNGGNVNARVREEHAAGQAGAAAMIGNQRDDSWQVIDDGYDLPPAATDPSSDQYQSQGHRSSSVLESSSPAAASQRRKRNPKVIKADSRIELRSRELLAMNTDYLVNMTNEQARTHALRASQQAKKNAEHWLLGRGLGDVGSGIGNSKAKGPLAEFFSGVSLYQWITGTQLEIAGQKRECDPDDITDTERQKRPRLNEEDQVGRAGPAEMLDDNFILQYDDTEIPREQPEALEDIHSAMPWNVMSSMRGSSVNRAQAGASGGPGSAAGSLGRRGSRMVSASPLVGRGRPSALGNFGDADPTSDAAMFGSTDDFIDEDFERYGPGANVDTQTAAQSSWQKAALDTESNNFYDFIENAIDEKRKAAEALDLSSEEIKDAEFEELLDPVTNSFIVAAQALLHVLTLGTKNLISVKQQEHYGPIQLSLLEPL